MRAFLLYSSIFALTIFLCILNVAELRKMNNEIGLKTAQNIFMLLKNTDLTGLSGQQFHDSGLLSVKLTSLHFDNSTAAPDEFEKNALNFMRKHADAKEYYVHHEENGRNILRYMGKVTLDGYYGTLHTDETDTGGKNTAGISLVIDTTDENTRAGILSAFVIACYALLIALLLWLAYLRRKAVKKNEMELNKTNFELGASDGTPEEQALEHMRPEDLLRRQARFASMGEMIGLIAHQWRQPLNAIGLLVQDIEDSYTYGELDDKYVREMVEKTMLQLNYMSRTIDDFRSFYKPDKSVESFNLADAIHKTVDLVAPSLNSRMIHYEVDIDDVKLKGYVNEFKQAVLNIINNASDAVFDNVPENTAGSTVRFIKIYDKLKSRHVEIMIEDNGGGIPGDVMEHMFEPYFTTKEEGKGTGIGLYMTKMIIETHMHGHVDIENTDTGARITITIPTADNGDDSF